jgi:CRISPR/Cas system-associated exonuclease Cas4 (RecB family)
MQTRFGQDITPGLPEKDNSWGDLLERSMSELQTDWPMFSYSQVQEWLRCEYRWYLGYRRGWRSDRNTRALSTGTKVHEGLEVYYGNENSKEAVEAWIKSEIEDAEAEELELLNRALYILQIYTDHAPKFDAGRVVVGTEMRLTVPFKTPQGRNYWFQGYVDLLDKVKTDHSVVDHKTTSTGFWSPQDAKMDPQTVLYAAGFREQGFKVKSTIINQLNTYPYKKMREVPVEKLFARMEITRSDAEMDSVIRQFGKAVDAIVDRFSTPIRALQKACSSCQFNEICYLKNQKVPVGPTLNAKFTKREGTAPA